MFPLWIKCFIKITYLIKLQANRLFSRLFVVQYGCYNLVNSSQTSYNADCDYYLYHFLSIPKYSRLYLFLYVHFSGLHSIFCFSQSVKPEIDEYADVKLEDLKEIATLGVGGFGRVELVSSLLF